MHTFPSGLMGKLCAAQHVVIFTGAGVSQESGIPTFRDALTGLWSQYNPEALATPEAFQKQPDLVWGWYEFRRQAVMQCSPNPAHLAIAAMSRFFRSVTVVTQNVDGLHERAGTPDVIRLHGSLHHPRCSACASAFEFPPDIPKEPPTGWCYFPPKCKHCGAWVRPGVVWFGESLPEAAWQNAQKAASSCDVFLSIGTSSLVYPAAELPYLASRQGACVIEINPAKTALSSIADYSLSGLAGEVLSALYAALKLVHKASDRCEGNS